MSGLFLAVAARAMSRYSKGASLMDESASVAYQSGQTVPLTGQYELAGAEPKPAGASGEKIVRDLKADELFLDHEGRAGAWHPVASKMQTSASSTG
jgi:hypothetical protein